MEKSPQPNIQDLLHQKRLEQSKGNPVSLELLNLKKEIATLETQFIDFKRTHPRKDPATEQIYASWERDLVEKHKRRNLLESTLTEQDAGLRVPVTEESEVGTDQRDPYMSSSSFLDSLRDKASKAKSLWGKAKTEAILQTQNLAEPRAPQKTALEPEAFTTPALKNPEPTIKYRVEEYVPPLEEALRGEGYDLSNLKNRTYEELKRLYVILYSREYWDKFKKEILSLDLEKLIAQKAVAEDKILSDDNIYILKKELSWSGIIDIEITPNHISFATQPSLEKLKRAERVLVGWKTSFPANQAITAYMEEITALIKEKEELAAQMQSQALELNKSQEWTAEDEQMLQELLVQIEKNNDTINKAIERILEIEGEMGQTVLGAQT